jgi:hypothetical protein
MNRTMNRKASTLNSKTSRPKQSKKPSRQQKPNKRSNTITKRHLTTTIPLNTTLTHGYTSKNTLHVPKITKITKNTQTPRHFSSLQEHNVFLQDSTQIIAQDPKDGTVNSNPGYRTPAHLPKAEHLVSPHLRKFVHEIEETAPTPSIRAPIEPKHLKTGYRYILRHLKYMPDVNRRVAFRDQIRADFDLLMNSSTLELAEVQFDRSIPTIWSQLSVIRMGLTKLRRPKIPESLAKVAEYLGAQEGSGYFCAIPRNDERFKTSDINGGSPVRKPAIIEARGEKFAEKAKMYNMDLHPADIERHYELVERFHFNGKERRGY